MLSERAAAGVLTEEQGIGREQARQLLLTGVAGESHRIGRATGYDDELVEELAARPPAALSLLAETCPHGVYVVRLRRGRPFRIDWPWEKQVASLALQPAPPPLTHAFVVQVPIRAFGGLPWVVTVSGFVVFAAVATGSVLEGGGLRFDLVPAEAWRKPDWRNGVARRWFHTGPGRPWFLWHPDQG